MALDRERVEGRATRRDGSRWRQALRAFESRNYRLYFAGQGISLIGTWMQRTAMGWLVYRLTDSAFMLGLVGFLSALPAFLFSPLAGVVADRYNRRPLLVMVYSLAMLQALVLAITVVTGVVTIWQVLVLGILLGFVEAMEMPLRLSFLSEIVDRRVLGNAIGLNSAMVNSSRLIGPSLAGLLIASMGESACFLINCASYLGVIVSLLLMRAQPSPKLPQGSRIAKELREGFAYAWGFRAIRDILLLLGLMSLVAMPYTVLMPVFAKDILKGGPHTLGFLLGASGIGAVAGALILVQRRSVVGLEGWITAGAVLFGGGLLAFSLSRVVWASLALMVVAGFGMIAQAASSNTLIQTLVDEDKRGRVMSIYAMAWRGMVPFGSLLAGSIANWLGAPLTLALCGGCCLAGGLWFVGHLPALKAEIRPILNRMETTT